MKRAEQLEKTRQAIIKTATKLFLRQIARNNLNEFNDVN